MVRRANNERSVQLKPADPFELIRWLARSQSDPRKAVAELVQNSLDAGARRVVVERSRVKGELQICVRDDGEGVLVGLEREEALTYVATHIGHSHKLGIDPAERRARVVAGKYGVGLLGFWSIGKRLELRSRVAGSSLWALRMEEESPRASVLAVPLRTDAPPTYTEVVVGPMHAAAHKALGGRRLSEYLASELRGQLLSSRASVTVVDRAARGTAQKQFAVAPRRYTGERLALPAELAVAGHAPILVELYLARGAERPAIELACAGTLVADDVAQVPALGLGAPPWSGCDLTGMIDFADFNVPPGSRRGVQPDGAAEAFTAAMTELEPLLTAELERLDAERRKAADANVVRELRRALRGLQSRLPHYQLPAVAGRAGAGDVPPGGVLSSTDEDGEGEAGGSAMPTAALFGPGPLAAVRIVPETIEIAPGSERRLRALATDADGQRLEGVALSWSLEDGGRAGLSIRGKRGRAALVAAPGAPLGLEAGLTVVAELEGASASAGARVRVAEQHRAGDSGIPEPHLVSDPEGDWRSRMAGERWEVNEAHRDYFGLRDDARAQLRYLLALLSKEIVLRTSGRWETADVLESMAEVLAHAERNLRGK